MDPTTAQSVFAQCGIAGVCALILTNIQFKHAFFHLLQTEPGVAKTFIQNIKLIREGDVKRIFNNLPFQVLQCLFRQSIVFIKGVCPSQVVYTLTTNGKTMLTYDLLYFDTTHHRYIRSKKQQNVHISELVEPATVFSNNLTNLFRESRAQIYRTICRKEHELMHHDIVDLTWTLHDVYVTSINFEDKTLNRSLFPTEITCFPSHSWASHLSRVFSVRSCIQLNSSHAMRQVLGVMYTSYNYNSVTV